MSQEHDPDTMREEYDFSSGVRGKHYQAYRRGTNLVLLEPDVAAIFKDAATANAALRMLAKIAKESVSTQDESYPPPAADGGQRCFEPQRASPRSRVVWPRPLSGSVRRQFHWGGKEARQHQWSLASSRVYRSTRAPHVGSSHVARRTKAHGRGAEWHVATEDDPQWQTNTCRLIPWSARWKSNMTGCSPDTPRARLYGRSGETPTATTARTMPNRSVMSP